MTRARTKVAGSPKATEKSQGRYFVTVQGDLVARSNMVTASTAVDILEPNTPKLNRMNWR